MGVHSLELVHRRVALALGCLALLLCALVGQLARIQLVGVLSGRHLQQEALRQRTLGIPIEVARGGIYDRNLVSLTSEGARQSVVVFPTITAGKQIRGSREQWQEMLAGLSAVLGVPSDELDAVLGVPAPPRRLRANVTPEVAQAVWMEGWPGIIAVTETVRYGPGSLARHLVGYVLPHAYTNPAYNLGVSGLEARYDAVLRGSGPNLVVATVDAHHQLIPGLGYRVQESGLGNPGHALVLTLDAAIQRRVEEVMDARDIQNGAAVVLDPYTGAVLAMASRPNYDQNQPHLAFAIPGALTNAAVSAYPAGSVFKLVVAAAALEEGVTSLDEEFRCPGAILAGNRTFTCPRQAGRDRGSITLVDAMAYSCNVVFIELAQRLGARRLLEYAGRFGLGSATGLPLDREAGGRLPWELGMGPAALANLALGQGVLEVTPLQKARIVAALVNDGIMPVPWVVREIRTPRGEILEQPQPPGGTRVVRSETARQLRLLMFAVTAHGTGRLAQIPSRAAGKTGSAQSYPGMPPHSWFVGFAPFYVPRYVLVVFAEKAGAGGLVAAPVFRAIMEGILP
jgi:cell division protein FtsI/penicillin-binding protein 2